MGNGEKFFRAGSECRISASKETKSFLIPLFSFDSVRASATLNWVRTRAALKIDGEKSRKRVRDFIGKGGMYLWRGFFATFGESFLG